MTARRKSGPALSVIIPTYNRGKVLADVLPSYVDESVVKEIIIVDDAGSERVEEQLDEILGQLAVPVRVLRHDRNLGPPAARNTGLDAALGELCFFGEDDVQLGPDFLRTLLSARAALGVDFIAGEVLLQSHPDETYDELVARAPVLDDDGVDERYGWRKSGTIRARPMQCRLANALILGPRDALRRVRADEKLWGPTYAWEEFDLQLRLQAQGYTLGVTPEAIGIHLARSLTTGGGGRSYDSLVAEVASVIYNGLRHSHRNRRILRQQFTRFPRLKYGLIGSLRHSHFRMKRLLAHRQSPLLRFVSIRKVRD